MEAPGVPGGGFWRFLGQKPPKISFFDVFLGNFSKLSKFLENVGKFLGDFLKKNPIFPQNNFLIRKIYIDMLGL